MSNPPKKSDPPPFLAMPGVWQALVQQPLSKTDSALARSIAHPRFRIHCRYHWLWLGLMIGHPERVNVCTFCSESANNCMVVEALIRYREEIFNGSRRSNLNWLLLENSSFNKLNVSCVKTFVQHQIFIPITDPFLKSQREFFRQQVRGAQRRPSMKEASVTSFTLRPPQSWVARVIWTW